MTEEKFAVTGMSCAACSARVEKAVSEVAGVSRADVNLLTNSMTVKYAEELCSKNDIISAVIKAGYGAEPMAEVKNKEAVLSTAEKAAASLKKRLISSLIILVPLMWLTMGHMVGLPLPEFLSGGAGALNMAISQLVLSGTILVINNKYFVNGIKNLARLSPNMDSLIAVGSGASYIYGIYITFKIAGAVSAGDLTLAHELVMGLYFEGAGMIVTLIDVGKYLEARSKSKTSDALSKLIDMTPENATVIRNGEEQVIPAENVAVGDIVVVRPGQKIPVDGIITEGSTAIDESALTGESMPAEKTEGDKVYSATINKSGFIKFKAEKVGSDTSFAKIIRLVEDASSSKAPIARFADKVSGIFVPTVIGIAIITFIVWMLSGAEFSFALTSAISVLVISCPCALGLATPVAIMVGTGKGAENGILIKSAEYLEYAGTIDTVVFDKTGTLTEGVPEIKGFATAGDITECELLSITASIESKSEHPLAAAVIKRAEEKNAPLLDVENFGTEAGKGVFGEIDGVRYYVGNRRIMDALGCDLAPFAEFEHEAATRGMTPLYVAKNGVTIGVLAAADRVRQSSKLAVKALKKMNVETVMLTGDTKAAANAVCAEIGISEAISEVLPEDKEKKIAELSAAGRHVAMVGDGINDAPALARADVGIAIGGGTDVAMDCADVVLVQSDPLGAAKAILLSRAVIKNIKQNLFWAFFYNCLGIPLAAGVFYNLLHWQISPMFAAAAMSLSSVSVVTNALRLKKLNLEPERHYENHEACELCEQPLPETEKSEEERKTFMRAEIKVDGMMCMHCVAHVEEALRSVEGVTEAKADLGKNMAFAEYNEPATIEQLEAAIEKAGYTVVK